MLDRYVFKFIEWKIQESTHLGSSSFSILLGRKFFPLKITEVYWNKNWTHKNFLFVHRLDDREVNTEYLYVRSTATHIWAIIF